MMDGFQTLPNEQEIVNWLEEEVWKDEEEARTQVMEGIRFLSIEQWSKRMMLTMSTEEQVNTFLEVMRKEGERGRLWPGVEGEVRVRAEAMTRRSIVITVMDVAPETDKELVRRAMEKFGTVKRCERMTLPAPYNRVELNKMKVELVRNGEKMPNIIHAFGTARSADDFLTWKLQYRGCPRYCYSCGATSHEARQCTERRAAREKLEKVASLVGEEQEETGEEQLSYAAVLKDPTFLVRQRRERDEEARGAAEREEQRTREREARSAREEQDRQEVIAREGEAEGRKRAEREREEEGREMELEESVEREPPLTEGNTPPPPQSGEVTEEVEVEGVPKVVVEEAKVAGVVVAEEAKVATQTQPSFLTPAQPRQSRGAKKGVETKQPPQVLKRGSSAGKIVEMEPGEERDGKIVRLEDGGDLTTWQGRKGRERSSSEDQFSEGGSSPRKRQSSSSPSSPRGSSKASRTTPGGGHCGGGGGPTRSTQPLAPALLALLAPALDRAALDKNSNTPPAAGAGHQNGC